MRLTHRSDRLASQRAKEATRAVVCSKRVGLSFYCIPESDRRNGEKWVLYGFKRYFWNRLCRRNWELSLGQTSLAGRIEKAEEATVRSEGGGRSGTVGTEHTRTSQEA